MSDGQTGCETTKQSGNTVCLPTHQKKVLRQRIKAEFSTNEIFLFKLHGSEIFYLSYLVRIFFFSKNQVSELRNFARERFFTNERIISTENPVGL